MNEHEQQPPNEIEVPIRVERGPTSLAKAAGNLVGLGILTILGGAFVGAAVAVAVLVYRLILWGVS